MDELPGHVGFLEERKQHGVDGQVVVGESGEPLGRYADIPVVDNGEGDQQHLVEDGGDVEKTQKAVHHEKRHLGVPGETDGHHGEKEDVFSGLPWRDGAPRGGIAVLLLSAVAYGAAVAHKEYAMEKMASIRLAAASDGWGILYFYSYADYEGEEKRWVRTNWLPYLQEEEAQREGFPPIVPGLFPF